MKEALLLVDYALLARDVEQQLADWGYRPTRAAPRELSVARFPLLLRQHTPSLLLSINYSPELAWLCTQHQLPYVSWTVDPLPNSRCVVLPETQIGLCLALCHSRPLAARLVAAGLKPVAHLPLAAANHRARRLPARSLEPYRAALTFVGSSLAAESKSLEGVVHALGLPAERVASVDRLIESAFEHHKDNPNFTGVSAADWERIEAATGPRDWQTGERARLLEHLNGRLAHLHRSYIVRGLSDLGLRVYGDAGWSGIASDFRGAAHHGDELTRIYQASAANLDLVRLYQREIVTLRAMDALSSGSVLLTEAGGELPQLVGTDAVVTYDTLSQLRQRIGEIADGMHCGVGAIAAERVRQSHQLGHRVAVLLEHAADRGWIRQPELGELSR